MEVISSIAILVLLTRHSSRFLPLRQLPWTHYSEDSWKPPIMLWKIVRAFCLYQRQSNQLVFSLANDVPAGYPFDKLRNTKTSVYTGCFTDDYNHLNSKDPEQASQYSMSGLSPSILANRISWFFNFTGASVNINTACSSSLVALDLACQSLMTGESEMVCPAWKTEC